MHYHIYSLNVCREDGHDLDLVSGDNFRDIGRLIDDESRLQLLDACLASLHSLLDRHVLRIVLVKH